MASHTCAIYRQSIVDHLVDTDKHLGSCSCCGIVGSTLVSIAVSHRRTEFYGYAGPTLRHIDCVEQLLAWGILYLSEQRQHIAEVYRYEAVAAAQKALSRGPGSVIRRQIESASNSLLVADVRSGPMLKPSDAALWAEIRVRAFVTLWLNGFPPDAPVNAPTAGTADGLLDGFDFREIVRWVANSSPIGLAAEANRLVVLERRCSSSSRLIWNGLMYRPPGLTNILDQSSSVARLTGQALGTGQGAVHATTRGSSSGHPGSHQFAALPDSLRAYNGRRSLQQARDRLRVMQELASICARGERIEHLLEPTQVLHCLSLHFCKLILD